MQTSHSPSNRCESAELTCAYVLDVLRTSEGSAIQAHIASCPDCLHELESLRPVVNRFFCAPADILRPSVTVLQTCALPIAEETGKQPVLPAARQWSEPEWEQVAPGI